MYSEKIVRGAKIDPCVTPCANRSKSDNTAEMAQVWVRSRKQDLNHLKVRWLACYLTTLDTKIGEKLC